MGVFTLKRGDTLPLLTVTLKNPDGSVHDLTGSSSYKLHVRVTPTTTMSRDMTLAGAPTLGTLTYLFVAADWGSPNLPIVAASARKELPMEYEVIAGVTRMTFPNDGYDTVKIVGDLGSG